MSITLKNRHLVLGLLALFLLFGVVGYIIGHRKADRLAEAEISTLQGKIKAYSYTIDSLQKYAYEMEQVVTTQKEAIAKGEIEKRELKKLHLKAVNEVTMLKGQIQILKDSVPHDGDIIDTDVILIDTEDEEVMSKPAIVLPFNFAERNKYYSFTGGFDTTGKMMVDLSVPLDITVWTGYNKEEKEYKAVITSLNPVVKINEIKSFKFDAPKPKRFGIGAQVGYGVSTTGLTPYIGLGISYNLLTF